MKQLKRVLYMIGPYVIGPALRLYGKVVFNTSRITVHGAAPQGVVVLAIWHGRLAFVPLLAVRPTAVLSSPSKDGRLGAVVAAAFGFESLAGSSSKQAAMGARRAVQALRRGTCLFLTPDGPKGPQYVAKEGATAVAKLAKVSVVPCGASCTRGKVFASWDKLLLPLPFGRIHVVYGAALAGGTAATVLAAALTAAQLQADTLCNRVGKPACVS
jgi:lysophospholipid acyltransferase (LPLAT)-like uncharacterized protein